MVRITDTEAPEVTDQSDSPFTIYQPTLTVNSPNGGESWQAGSSHAITWTSTWVDEVKIEYSTDNGTEWSVIISNASAATGSYEWIVPDAESEECLVRITSVANPTISDQSDAPFAISLVLKKITILSPNGGEEWMVGTQEEIWWESSYIWDFTLEYSIDNGSHWIYIDDFSIDFITVPENPSQLSYPWTVPVVNSQYCLVRMTSSMDSLVSDQSDDVFIIWSVIPLVEEEAGITSLAVTPYPNPFNPQTTISYQLPKPAEVTITIYNSLGQKVREYPIGRMELGIHEVVFDASGFTSGLYFYRVDAGYKAVTGKMLYMK